MELFTATGKLKFFQCVTRGAHIEHLSSCQKKNLSVFLWL